MPDPTRKPEHPEPTKPDDSRDAITRAWTSERGGVERFSGLEHYYIYDEAAPPPSGKLVAEVYGVRRAHLIAAAPEMYEALRFIRGDKGVWHRGAQLTGEHREKINTALAKAEGEQAQGGNS